MDKTRKQDAKKTDPKAGKCSCVGVGCSGPGVNPVEITDPGATRSRWTVRAGSLSAQAFRVSVGELADSRCIETGGAASADRPGIRSVETFPKRTAMRLGKVSGGGTNRPSCIGDVSIGPYCITTSTLVRGYAAASFCATAALKIKSPSQPTSASRAQSFERLRGSHHHGAIVLIGANFNAFTSDSDMLKAHDSQSGVFVGLCQYVVGDLQDMQHSTIPPCSFVIQCGSGAT